MLEAVRSDELEEADIDGRHVRIDIHTAGRIPDVATRWPVYRQVLPCAQAPIENDGPAQEVLFSPDLEPMYRCNSRK